MRYPPLPQVELARIVEGPLASRPGEGANGAFAFKGPQGATLRVIASDGGGWEHVSVSCATRTPRWDEMDFVKGLFWSDEEAVMQLHPPRSQWVNNHPFTLHLWRPLAHDIPLPPATFVGILGMDAREARKVAG